MLNISHTKRHIKSIKNIEQITNAMKLISISKMRKSNEQYLNNLRYFDKIRSTIKHILYNKGEVSHLYLQPRARHKSAFVVIASDTGMAGEYNQRILNYALKKITGFGDDKCVYAVGRMAADFFIKNGIEVDTRFVDYTQNPNISHAQIITAYLLSKYHDNEIDEINIIFSYHFDSRINKAMMLRLLPMLLEDFEDVECSTEHCELEFEPSVKEVFSILVPQYIVGLTYSCLSQSVKCENEERMDAMNTATNNAKDMLESLKLEYHRARQEQITTELTEISSEAFRD